MNEKQRMEKLSLSWNRGKMNRFALLNFKILWGHAPRPRYWGGATAPLPDPTPWHSGALRALLGAFGSSIVPLCVDDILRYFRPWIYDFWKISADWCTLKPRTESKLLLCPGEILFSVAWACWFVCSFVSSITGKWLAVRLSYFQNRSEGVVRSCH